MAKYKFVSKYNVGLKGGHDATYLIRSVNSIFEDYKEEDEYRDGRDLREYERDDIDLITKKDLEKRRAWRNKQLQDIHSELLGLCRCAGDYDASMFGEIDEIILIKSKKVEKKCLSKLKREVKKS